MTKIIDQNLYHLTEPDEEDKQWFLIISGTITWDIIISLSQCCLVYETIDEESFKQYQVVGQDNKATYSLIMPIIWIVVCKQFTV